MPCSANHSPAMPRWKRTRAFTPLRAVSVTNASRIMPKSTKIIQRIGNLRCVNSTQYPISAKSDAVSSRLSKISLKMPVTLS